MMRRAWRRIRIALYWCLPPLILYLVLRRIDLAQLAQLAAAADGLAVLAAIALLLPVTALGALRWHWLLRRYGCAEFSFGTSFLEYWRSLAAGLLLPGSLGSDAYRVLLVGERSRAFLRAALAVAVEKLAALAGCALLVACTYPFLGATQLPEAMLRFVDAVYLVGVAVLLLGLGLAVLRRAAWLPRVASAFARRLEALAAQAAGRAAAPGEGDAVASSRMGLLLSVFSPRVALPALALSLAMFALLALQSQLLFRAFDHPIGLGANLFVTPLLILLYSLPISFGGLGIREGAFILAYGAFGVPAETALAISLCGLFGNLLSYAIGASLFLGKPATRAAQPGGPAPCPITKARP